MRRGGKNKEYRKKILNVILIHSKRKRKKERVLMKNNPKPFSPTLAGFTRRLQLESLARLYSKLHGFNIYLRISTISAMQATCYLHHAGGMGWLQKRKIYQ